ncbi:hypothetical protein Tco_1533477 [Tanacetum coccineum]
MWVCFGEGLSEEGLRFVVVRRSDEDDKGSNQRIDWGSEEEGPSMRPSNSRGRAFEEASELRRRVHRTKAYDSSFRRDMKGVGLRVADSHTGNHLKDDFMPLETFGGVGDEEVVVGEGVVVTSSSLEILTNSCLGGIMVCLIFLEGLEEEALVEFMVELFEEDEDDKKNEKDGLFNLKANEQSRKA